MGNRRSKSDRRRGKGRTDPSEAEDSSASRARRSGRPQADEQAIVVNGWTILAHKLFVGQLEKLTAAAEKERRKNPGAPGPNGKLLGRLIDLAFNRIPQDPGNPAYRQGKTLGNARKAWFRAKTGNGRYRLFFRFQSKSKVIVYAWVNDEHTLRT